MHLSLFYKDTRVSAVKHCVSLLNKIGKIILEYISLGYVQKDLVAKDKYKEFNVYNLKLKDDL